MDRVKDDLNHVEDLAVSADLLAAAAGCPVRSLSRSRTEDRRARPGQPWLSRGSARARRSLSLKTCGGTAEETVSSRTESPVHPVASCLPIVGASLRVYFMSSRIESAGVPLGLSPRPVLESQRVDCDSTSQVLRARCGWETDFPTFCGRARRRSRLPRGLPRGASESQVFAWDDSIPKLQTRSRRSSRLTISPTTTPPSSSTSYPLSFAGRTWSCWSAEPSSCLSSKARKCPNKPTSTRPPPTRATCAATTDIAPTARCTRSSSRRGRRLRGRARRRPRLGPDALHELVQHCSGRGGDGPLTASDFLARDAYCPLPYAGSGGARAVS